MNPSSVLNDLDELVRSRSIRQHPFYQAWRRGELTRDQLATYARVYYPHVAAFPGYLQAAIDRTTDPEIRAELQRNLADELTSPKPHPELWLDFAEECGLHREEVRSATPHAAAEGITGTFSRLATEGTPSGVAALYAYESQQPEVAREKADGLRGLYGMTSEKALAYFDVHATVDTVHRQGERDVLTRCLDAGAQPEDILGAANEGLQAYWELLDGVCEEAGIASAC